MRGKDSLTTTVWWLTVCCTTLLCLVGFQEVPQVQAEALPFVPEADSVLVIPARAVGNYYAVDMLVGTAKGDDRIVQNLVLDTGSG